MEKRKESQNKYYYRVYGLNIESELKIPILMESYKKLNKTIDIEIGFGKVDRDINEKIRNKVNAQFQKKRMWFHVNNVGTYEIKNGNSIKLDLESRVNENDVKSFILGSALGMALIQKNIIAIHGGAVVIDDKAIILTGDTGAGKSTLTSAFRLCGYGVLSDDVSVLGNNFKNQPVVNPGYPQQKLCGDTMGKLGFNKENFLLVDEDREKYVIPIRDEFIDNPIKLHSIYQIEEDDVAEVKVSEILGIEKIKVIFKNIYRIEVVAHSDMNDKYIKMCLKLAQRIKVYSIKRPRDKFTVDDQMKLILKKIDKQINR